MVPRIEILAEKKLVGKHIKMSFSNNKTGDLWRSFMPRRKEISNTVGSELYSVEVYDPLFFNKFKPETEFDKWAAIEVKDYDTVPEEMETITLPRGLYAVFIHKGPASTGPNTYQYIFGTWLPGSDFLLDSRPHFAIMGEKYKKEDPDSEEEVWIPIRPKEYCSYLKSG
jgi:AraC family transcriptional regulator